MIGVEEGALRTIRGLLQGKPPDGTIPEELGAWEETIKLLYAAYADQGTPGVRAAFHLLVQQDPRLQQVVLGDDRDREPLPRQLRDLLNELPLTDAGQGESIALLYGDTLRYDHSRADWLVWDGVRWSPNLPGTPTQIAKRAARRRLEAAAALPNEGTEDKKKRLEALRWAMQAENLYRIKSALALAQTEQPISATAEKFDLDPWLLACANGIVDLRTGQLRDGQPDDMLTLSTNVPYDPTAYCPRWQQFLQEVFLDDTDLIAFIQRAVGYCLTGSTREQVLFMLWGSGANGKTVFLGVLRGILGEYAANTRFDTFLAEPKAAGASASPDLAALRGARLVTASEVAEGRILNEARLKTITGGDPITARFLHANFFTFVPHLKLWLAVNHKPQVRETEEAIWRRIRLVPFTAYFPPGRADADLPKRLEEEAPGILAWAIEGCLQWQAQGLGQPAAVVKATTAYRAEQDVVGRFLDECTVQAPTATVEVARLYAEYKTWCEANGERPETGNKFGRCMTDRGFQRGKAPTTRRTVYMGVGLLAEGGSEEEAAPQAPHQAPLPL